MIHRASWERKAQLAVVLLCALALKQFYSAASVNELRWILAPTTLAVELVSGSRFAFESYSGYVKSDHTFVIAGSCAGVNFLITAFLLLALGSLWRNRSRRTGWRFLPIAAGCAYVATIVANTVRITTALQLHGKGLELAGLSPNEFHRLQGIFIYFGFLLLLYLVTERLSNKAAGREALIDSSSSPAFQAHLLQKSLFPLAIYYVTTLGVPFANAVVQRGVVTGDFWSHARFVLLAPLVVLVPVATLHFIRSRRCSPSA
ncbi:MAG TPA: exosortase K [Pyrinomonadaceae bacterium]|nr:exosortase K [Pyrinomonadaceae bacterium]